MNQKLCKKLNYGIAILLNRAILNEYNLPIHYCNSDIYPDFIALNTEKSKYKITPNTAVAFYAFDKTFDSKNGLYNAIYYQDKRLLKKFRKIYKGVKFVIAPDYSLYDDIWQFENYSRLLKIRVIMLWFTLEIGAVVIPNAIYLSSDKLPIYYSGFEECNMMCFSTKGHMKHSENRNKIKENVKYVTDNLNLKIILVYTCCASDTETLKLFEYAIQHGITVILVDNTLRQRNKILMTRREING